MKKHAIITSCNQRYGDFFIHHWYASLQKNVNLKDIDIILLDYGLNKNQLHTIKNTDVIIKTQSYSKQVVNKRFIDAEKLLKKYDYDQILMIDCGDIIFQADISNLFEKDKNKFRAVVLDLEVLFHEIFIPGNFNPLDSKKIYTLIQDKPVINAGFILGPRKKIVNLCASINQLIKRKDTYGPDQVVVNYFLHREGVVLLRNIYNFMINNVKDSFYIKNGTFYTIDHTLIPVVHNAGHNGFLRPILNFGYGHEYNKINFPMYFFKRWYYGNLKYMKKLASIFVRYYCCSK